MILAFASFLLLAAPLRVDLVNQVYTIPAKDWRYIDVGLEQRPGAIFARFNTAAESAQVRLALMEREELERFRKGLAPDLMAATEPASSGRLDFNVPLAGHYVLVIHNQAYEDTSVHLRVKLEFAAVTTLSPARQFTVIVISCAFFLGVVTFSARQLLRAVKDDKPPYAR
jgi:hypothetical protein